VRTQSSARAVRRTARASVPVGTAHRQRTARLRARRAIQGRIPHRDCGSSPRTSGRGACTKSEAGYCAREPNKMMPASSRRDTAGRSRYPSKTAHRSPSQIPSRQRGPRNTRTNGEADQLRSLSQSDASNTLARHTAKPGRGPSDQASQIQCSFRTLHNRLEVHRNTHVITPTQITSATGPRGCAISGGQGSFRHYPKSRVIALKLYLFRMPLTSERVLCSASATS
jgi:hypothetical protein